MKMILQPPPTPPPPPWSLWIESASGLPLVFPLTVLKPEKNEGSGDTQSRNTGRNQASPGGPLCSFPLFHKWGNDPPKPPAASGQDRTGTRVGLKQRAERRLPNMNLGPPHGGCMGGRAPQVPTGACPSQPPSTEHRHPQCRAVQAQGTPGCSPSFCRPPSTLLTQPVTAPPCGNDTPGGVSRDLPL